jgi:diaminohydroxyphosphoribosylaminopyrimidine deaminase/5-amino-6-(5-phosphoribosylamino)uracil reductase
MPGVWSCLQKYWFPLLKLYNGELVKGNLYLHSNISNQALETQEMYMFRCLELAAKGAGSVAPNPMVGAVVVLDDKIISEGYHQHYGGPHAEVNALKAVPDELLQKATLYVSLEPCAHYGKTPPCANLIIQKKIPKVVIGCRDPFIEVNGKGIEKLKKAGVEVVYGALEKECIHFNQRFFTFHEKKRPYIILKWAQTSDGFMAAAHPSRLYISNDYTNRLVHQWRAQEAAILIGSHTALADDPALTVRLVEGKNPVRLLLDRNLQVPTSLRLFDQTVKTIVFNTQKQEQKDNLLYYRLPNEKSLLRPMLQALYQLNIQSVLVEGGAGLLHSFIEEELWDEARVITNTQLFSQEGLSSPPLQNGERIKTEKILTDTIAYYKPANRN